MLLNAFNAHFNASKRESFLMRQPTVSTATPEEVAEALLKRGKTKVFPPLTCPGCEKSFIPIRSWQRYCSTSCRSQINNNAVKQEINDALAALIQENRLLRARVEELEEKWDEAGRHN